MLRKLYDRNARAGDPPLGLSCDEDGLFFGGDLPLAVPVEVQGRSRYQVGSTQDIGRALSAAYGTDFDCAAYMPRFRRVADLMTAGQWGLAKITALQMGLPDLLDRQGVERLSNAESMRRFNSNHYPAGPRGGQFAPRAGTEAASNTDSRPQARPRIPRTNTPSRPSPRSV